MDIKQRGKFIYAIYQYQKTGIVPELEFGMDMAVSPIINQFVRDGKKYENIVERNRLNGLKGGRKANPTDSKKTQRTQSVVSETQKTQSVVLEPKQPDNDNDNDNDSNNNKTKAFFVADANLNEKQYRLYLFDVIKQKQSSRDVLFMQNKINLKLRNDLWIDFVTNAIMESPQIESDSHAWNCFKRFVKENAKNYHVTKESNFKGFD